MGDPGSDAVTARSAPRGRSWPRGAAIFAAPGAAATGAPTGSAARIVAAPADTAVAAFMRRTVDAASEQKTVGEAMLTLFREDVEVLPVVSAEDKARVVGVVSPIDVARKVLWLKKERMPLLPQDDSSWP